MKFDNVCIESLGYHLPEEKVSSSMIEDMLSPIYDRLKFCKGRLEMMTGIKERRFWKKGTPPSSPATFAARKALASANIDISKIGCLIHTSVSRDCLEPATATIIHQQLNLPEDTMVYDISNACLGFLNGLVNVANMIQSRQIDAGIVVAAESARSLVEGTIDSLLKRVGLNRKNIKNDLASLTIGSGAVSAVLTHESISREKHKLLGGAFMNATQFNHLCRGGIGGQEDLPIGEEKNSPLMVTLAEELMIKGCDLAKKTWGRAQEALGWTNDIVDRFVCHQVGTAHRKMLYETLGIDINKDFSTLEFLGNVGSVSLPVTLAMSVEKGLVKKGDKLALLGIGSGINSLMLGVEW